MTNSGSIFRCLLAGAALAAAMGFSEPARAEVSVNINLGPPVVVAEPPHMVLVPRSQVYFSPDPQVDIFFYGGYWWSPRGDRWYRARAHNGPWAMIDRRRVPRQVIVVPRDYRSRFEREKRVPYGQWKKEHKQVEKAERKEQKRDEKEGGGRERNDRDDEGHGKHGR
ncbi:MAG TPA: hypothetical protein VF325_04755 [Candidatus Deferrimicrobium sp.]